MKHLFNCPLCRTGWVKKIGCAVLLAAAATAPAQSDRANLAPGQARKQTIEQAAADSAALFVIGNATSAEAALFKVNASKSGTAIWHLESARRLIEMGLSFQGNRNFALGRQVAERAFPLLDVADKKFAIAADAKGQALARSQIAFIYDCFLGDITTARMYYAQAAQLNPHSTNAVSEAARLGGAIAQRERKK